MRLVTVFILALTAACSLTGRREAGEPQVSFDQDPANARSVAEDLWAYGGDATPTTEGLEGRLHGYYSLPPDRALLRAEVRVRAESRSAVVARAREIAATLTEALEDGHRCEVELLHESAPARRGPSAYEEALSLRLDVVFGGADSVLARHDAIEGCLARFTALELDDALSISVSAPLITVDDPEAHRAAVLEERLRGIRDVEALGGPVRPVACVSQGQVTIVERSLSGVSLAVDLRCEGVAVRHPTPVPAAAAPRSARL